ncbi:MAG: glutathione peroxidase [Bacteroidaceae bacterium]|nr:glutathione peroxidase [Bacteroidaceae bacterium]
MKQLLLTLSFACLCLTGVAQRNIYGFTGRGQGGREIPMSEYRGKVVLIVNTATHCGFTPQYTALQNLYEKYRDRGLVILDFPCNQFGEQAPGTISEINQFCSANFATTFQRFDKVLVNGENATPLFTFLKKKLPFRGFDLSTELGRAMDGMLSRQDANYAKSADIKWNFTKFLVNRKGKPVQRFEPTADMAELEAAILKLL